MSDDFSCPQCQFGRCKSTTATYTQLYLGSVMCAPDLPAYVCDVCGYCEFDHEALRRVLTLLDRPEDLNTIDLPAFSDQSPTDSTLSDP